jgi:hypothetical protein
VLIPVNNLMLVAKSLEDAYQQRRARMQQPTAEAHLELADWCLQNGLLSQAQQELADARTLDARSGKLLMLERRLALANERQTKQPVAPTEDNSHQIVLLSAESQTAVSELPPSAVERFTRKVQPVLVNNCTTIGCHEAGGKQKFQLDRAILRGLSNRRSTMNNLAATLELIDRERPQLSPLLTVPRITHGGMKQPVFGPRHEQAFRHLEDWVALVTKKTAKRPPAKNAKDSAAGDAEQALYQETSPDNSDDDSSAVGDVIADRLPSQQIRYGAQLQRWQPRDPFDPEIFNRQNGSRELTGADDARVGEQTTAPSATQSDR